MLICPLLKGYTPVKTFDKVLAQIVAIVRAWSALLVK